MASIRHASLLGGAIFFLLLLIPGVAHAQQVPTGYLYVEVKDSAGNALTDATVQVSAADGKQFLAEKSKKDGTVDAKFTITHESYYDLRVSKAGYLPSEHVIHYSPFSVEKIPPALWGVEAAEESPVRIVLAGIPATEAERRAAEIEERKRRLLLAAKRGDGAGVRKLLEAGVSANVTNAGGVPAIAWAALAGDPETIKVLLDAGADVGKGSPLGHQALLIYLSEGLRREWGASQRRLYAGAVPGRHLLELREETVRRLVAAGAAVNVQNSRRGTVLNHAVGSTPTFTYPPEMLSVGTVRLLVAAGADVNAADTQGKTALMLAADQSSVELVRMLLEAKASVNVKDKLWGRSPLMYAIGHYDGANTYIVRALLAAGADVDAADAEGRTALMLASGNESAVKTLLEAGASVNAKDAHGRTALMYGAEINYDSRSVQTLIAAGADVDAANEEGQTALMLAAGTGNGTVVKTLLAAGASVNWRDKRGQTALMMAAIQPAYYGAVEVLIRAGADVNAADKTGRTALMAAASVIPISWQETPIYSLQLLLEAGAKPELVDQNGKTALMFAKEAGNSVFVRLLEEAKNRD